MNDFFKKNKEICIVFLLYVIFISLNFIRTFKYAYIADDCGHYLLDGLYISRGLIPFLDYTINQLPLVNYFHGMLYGVLRQTGLVETATILIYGLVIFLIYFSAKKIYNSKSAALFASFLFMSLYYTAHFDYGSASSRPFAVLLFLTGLLFFLHEKYLLCGMIWGLNCLSMLIQPLIIFPFIFIAWFIYKDRRAQINILTLCLLLAYMPCFLTWAAKEQFLHACVFYNIYYPSSSGLNLVALGQDLLLFVLFILQTFIVYKNKLLDPKIKILLNSSWLSFFLLLLTNQITSGRNLILIEPAMCLSAAGIFLSFKSRVVKTAFIAFFLIRFFANFYINTAEVTSLPVLTHADIKCFKTLPQPILTGRSPIIALESDSVIINWFYLTDFRFFSLYNNLHNNPENWFQVIQQSNSIMWQKNFFDLMPDVIKRYISENYLPFKSGNFVVFIKKSSLNNSRGNEGNL